MNARCQTLRDRLPSLEEEGRRVPDELRAHLAACEECAGWFARRGPAVAAVLGLEQLRAPDELEQRVAQALTGEARVQRAIDALRALPRQTAPLELDGLIVAAAHAGHREQRAAAWLRDGLAPLPAPAELAWRVAAELSGAEGGQRAPAELDARLGRDLRDLEGTLAARYAARLEPLPAPETLRTRVQETLERVGRQRRLALAALGLLAISALAFSGWRVLRPRSGAEAPAYVVLERPELGLEFEVRLVEPRALKLVPRMRALASAVTSGISDILLAAPVGSRSTPGSWAGRAPATSAGSQSGGGSDDHPSSPGDPQRELTDLDSQPFLEKLGDAPFVLRHSGVRQVVVRDPHSGETLELREQVWSDGKGEFAVELLGWDPDDLFGLMHDDREGFIQRFRDFRVRDLASFLERFELDLLDDDSTVAGRRVVVIEAVRRAEPLSHYRASIDPLTGLVLSYEERYGPNDELVASVEYESLDLDPNLEDVELSGGPSEWLEFEVDEPPPEIVNGLRQPGYTPRHHQFERAATMKGPYGRTWVEFVYGDGVEQVFFMHADRHADDPPMGPTGPERGDFVRVSRVGAWAILEGELRGTPIAALGKVDLDEMLLLVQSAFGG